MSGANMGGGMPTVTGGMPTTPPTTGGTPTVATPSATTNPQGETPPEINTDFKAWYNTLTPDARALVDQESAGLKAALSEERVTRKALEKRLDDALRIAEPTSAIRAELEQMKADYAAATRRNAFYDGAPADLGNFRLAFLAAEDASLIDGKNNVDWKRLREVVPELFRRPGVPSTHAGVGAQTPSSAADMNTAIRRAAGRGNP